MNISMQEIKYFVTAAECMNFTQAAQKLYTSQPVISKWIGKLENELGVKLFRRGQYGVELTPTGELLYTSWSKLLRDFDISLESAGIAVHPSDSILRVGALDMLRYESGIVEAVQLFERENPGVSVMLEYYNFKELKERFISGELNLIYTFSSALAELAGTKQMYFHPIDMYVATTDARAEENLSVLNGTPLLLVSPVESKHGGDRALEVCERLGIKPGEVWVMPNSTSLEMSMRSGKGFAIGGSYLRRGVQDSITLVPIDHELDGTRLMLVYKSGHLSRDVREYVKLVSRLAEQDTESE